MLLNYKRTFFSQFCCHISMNYTRGWAVGTSSLTAAGKRILFSMEKKKGTYIDIYSKCNVTTRTKRRKHLFSRVKNHQLNYETKESCSDHTLLKQQNLRNVVLPKSSV